MNRASYSINATHAITAALRITRRQSPKTDLPVTVTSLAALSLISATFLNSGENPPVCPSCLDCRHLCVEKSSTATLGVPMVLDRHGCEDGASRLRVWGLCRYGMPPWAWRSARKRYR